MPSSPAAIALTDVTVTYGTQVALAGVTLRLPAGAVTAVIGPNGSGKTTLLRAISGLARPATGRVDVLDEPAGRRRAAVAHVLQSTRVNERVPLTVREIVRMGRYPWRGYLGRLGAEDADAVADALARMAIADLADRHLDELSGGQRQRVYVAQGLAQRAEVLLLDEPITGLDLPSQERIETAVREEVASGRTVVLTTHDVETAAQAHHVVLLATHVVASGPPSTVLTDDHLGHAYGGRVFRTADGTLVLGDPHHHHGITGHERH